MKKTGFLLKRINSFIIFTFLPQQMEPGNGGETISPPFRPDGNEEDDSSPVLYPQKQIQITIQ